MWENQSGGLLDVIGQDEVPAIEQCVGLGEALQVETAPGAGSVFQPLGFTRCVDDVDEVTGQRIFHVDVGDGMLDLLEIGA